MTTMTRTTEIRKIAFVGDYLPRKCGIATFTYDVCTSVATQFPGSDCFVVPVNDLPQGYDYPREVRFEIEEQELDSYLRAADFLNFANADIVCLQHEYGIFGGPAGSHIIRLLRNLRMPIVTTLHTVLQRAQRRPAPGARPGRRSVGPADRDVRAGARVSQESLRRSRGQDRPDRPRHSRHGRSSIPPSTRISSASRGSLSRLTFGLLSPNKGIEHMLRAMPAILKEFPNFVYIVLGATHPNLIREQGERYRISLERLAKRPGHQAECELLQPLRRDRRADRVHRRGRHLRHALPEPGADHLGHAGLCVWLRQGGRLHALLARRGTAGRRPRGAGPVR